MIRWRIVPLLLLIAVLLALPVAARADAPGRLATQVTDTQGVLSDRTGVDAALRELQQDTGIQLFVVFVDSFDGTPAQQWTDETARLSDLGDRDALLAVATGDRAYAYSFPDDSRISTAELTDVASDDIEPELAAQDWSGAVIAAARGYQDAAGGSGGSGGSGQGLGAALLVLGAILVAALGWVLLRRRRRPKTPEAPPGPSLEDLAGQANALLIELDDDLRASEREGDLATAQYGTATTVRFHEALTAARADVAEAFRLRMTLEEVPVPDEATRRATLTRIIELCRAADARLDAESEAFDRLRDLEGRAAEVAVELDRQRTATEAALPAVAATAQDLLTRYSGTSVTAIAGNVDQARERLAFAAEALTRARAALDTPDAVQAAPAVPGSAAPGSPASAVPSGPASGGPASGGPGSGRAQAALAVRDAEQAIDQAGQLVAAVEKAATDLPAARTAAEALIREIEDEVRAARALPAVDHAAIPGGEQAVQEARTALSAARPDPVGVVARLQAADATLDQVLAEARDRADRDNRARAVLAQTLPVARAEVAATNDFITPRRGAVGPDARAQLSEALRHLAIAEQLAATDPAGAVQAAQQARQFATAAGHSAQSDVQTWNTAGPYGRTGGIDAGAFAGAVLGGILSGGMRSGGGGGWGGGFGGGGGGGWSGGGSRGGGFGGSGARARRGGGGRF